MGTAGITQGPRITGIFRAHALAAVVKAAALKILAAAGVGRSGRREWGGRWHGERLAGQGPEPSRGAAVPPPTALQRPARSGAAETPMLLGERQGIKGVAKQMLAALCLALLPAGLPADRHQRSLPAVRTLLHETLKTKPPRKHFFLLIVPTATLQPDGPVPCSATQGTLLSLSWLPRWRGGGGGGGGPALGTAQGPQVWGSGAVPRPARWLHPQFQKAPGTVKGPHQI